MEDRGQPAVSLPLPYRSQESSSGYEAWWWQVPIPIKPSLILLVVSLFLTSPAISSALINHLCGPGITFLIEVTIMEHSRTCLPEMVVALSPVIPAHGRQKDGGLSQILASLGQSKTWSQKQDKNRK